MTAVVPLTSKEVSIKGATSFTFNEGPTLATFLPEATSASFWLAELEAEFLPRKIAAKTPPSAMSPSKSSSHPLQQDFSSLGRGAGGTKEDLDALTLDLHAPGTV